MRNIKFVLAAVIAVFFTSGIFAQSVKIYKSDKSVIDIPYSELDSIVTFPVDECVNTIEFVDMGLSVMWANMNIGSTAPEEYGSYFAWGELSEKGSYTETNCITTGVEMKDITGNVEYDVAAAMLGDGARIPTKAEIEELVDNCTIERCTLNGVEGRLFKSKKNHNSIFLPAVGMRNGAKTNFAGTYGAYWSSTPKGGELSDNAYFLDFKSSYDDQSNSNRYYGYSVRAVKK